MSHGENNALNNANTAFSYRRASSTPALTSVRFASNLFQSGVGVPNCCAKALWLSGCFGLRADSSLYCCKSSGLDNVSSVFCVFILILPPAVFLRRSLIDFFVGRRVSPFLKFSLGLSVRPLLAADKVYIY